MNKQEELFPKRDEVTLPEGQTDKLEPFESVEKIEYRHITPQAYDGSNNAHLDEMGLLNLNKEHTGEEVMNSRGFYTVSVDPYNPLISESPEQYMEQVKRGLVFTRPEYSDNKLKVPFPELIEEMQQYYGNNILKERSKAIMAIDPGSNGCIAVLNASGEVFTYKMPSTPKDLFDLFKTLKNEYHIEATLEKVGGMPGNGGSRMFNFGQGYGYIEMALIALEIKTATVSSQAWQKTFLIGTKSKMSTTEWKNKLKAKAQQLYPSLRVTLGNADALLILEYAKNLKK